MLLLLKERTAYGQRDADTTLRDDKPASYSVTRIHYTGNMTLANLMRYSLLLMFALCMALAIYVYSNFDSVMRSVIIRLLQDYGVTDVRPVNIHWQKNRLMLDKLRLKGRQNDMGYTLSFVDIDIAYQWRELLRQQLTAVRVKSFDIAITDLSQETASIPEKVLDLTAFKPPTIISKLPMVTLTVDAWRLRYQKNNASAFSGAGTLHYDKTLRLNLQTVMSGAGIKGLITTDTDEQTLVDLSIAGENGKIAAFRAKLDSRNDPWSWAFEGDWQQDALLEWLHTLHLEFKMPALPITTAHSGAGYGSFSGFIKHPEIIQLDPARPNIAATGIEASLALSANIESIGYPAVLNDLSGKTEGTLTLQQGQLLVGLFMTDTVITGVGSDYAVELTAMRLNSEIETSAAFTVRCNAEGELLIQRDNKRSPVVAFSFEQAGPFDEITYKLDAALAESALILGISGELNLDTGQGGHKLTLHSGDLSRLNAQALPAMGDWFSLSSIPDVHSGELQLDTTFQTYDYDPTGWSQISQLSIEGFSVTYDGYSVEQASLTTQWTGSSEWRGLQPLKVNIDRVDAGFPVNSVSMTAAMTGPTPALSPELDILAFSADVFGGQILLETPTIWNFSAHTNSATLRVENWELAQIVALQQNQDIEAQGTIQGTLPIALSDGRLAVSKGYLNALPPGGTIRYNSSDTARNLGNNKQLGLAMDLLSDFRYEILKSEVDLDDQGNLVLGLSLGGRNPGHHGGQEVRFNIMVEQNLDPLLQSLRLSDTLSHSIENRLR